MPNPVKYLTTLDLDAEWLDAFAKACPDLEIKQPVVEHASDIDDAVWA